MGNGGFALFPVGVHGVGIEGQRGNVQSLCSGIVKHVLCILIVAENSLRVNVGDTGITAFSLTGRPACHLKALEAHFGCNVNCFLVGPAVQNSGEKTKLYHNYSLLVYH